MTNAAVRDEPTIERGLVRLEDTHLIVDQWGLTALNGSPSLGQCGIALQRITKVISGVKYWRGDLMNLADTLFAEEASQFIDSELLSESDARAEMFVAANVAATTSRSTGWIGRRRKTGRPGS
jgi:hypothetical protein